MVSKGPMNSRDSGTGGIHDCEAMCRTMFEHMISGVAIYQAIEEGSDFIINWFNQTAADIEQVEREQIIGKRLTEAFPRVREFGLLEVMRRVWQTGVAESFPAKLYADSRIQGWRENYVCKLPSGQLMTIYNDLTDEKKAEEALQESEASLKTILEEIQMGIFIVDAETHQIIDINTKALEMIEAEKEDVLGHVCHKFICAAECGKCPITDLHLAVDNAERVIVTTRGNLVPVLKTVTKIFIHGREQLVESFLDIRERKALEESLRIMGTTDYLTGISNRRHFMGTGQKELSRAQRYGKSLSLIMIDFDRFKDINDTYGHAAGDEVLKAIAGLCVGQLRESDIMGRMGGEEFAILPLESDQEQAIQLAERIRASAGELAVPLGDGQSIGCTLSIGVSSLSDTVEDLDQLLKKADEALYRAKEAGRNRVVLAGG